MEKIHTGHIIRVVNKEFMRLHSEKAVSMGLTSPQLFALHYLSEHQDEEICQRDVERNFDLSHAAVSGLVSRLEAKNFIICTTSSDDKRYKKIILTDKAKKVETEMRKYISGYKNQLMKGFSEEDEKTLRKYLLKMLINMNVSLPDGLKEEAEK